VILLEKNTVLKVRKINKTFPGTKALSDVSIELAAGEVHAVVGENGAGKSTLMNVISGVHQPDSGEIYISGIKANIQNPKDAQDLGIGFVHQEIALCQHVSVAENIFMGSINTSKKPLVNYGDYYKKTEALLKDFRSNINPRQKVSELTVSEQQIVEIVKALSLNCKIIIFDEPTSALTEGEAETLFRIMRELKAKGISILYISHRMAEVFENCDRVTVLRDGFLVDTLNISETDQDTVINKMVGRNISCFYPDKDDEAKELLLEVKNFNRPRSFHDINFSLYKGEILGFSGLVGAGRSGLARAICGIDEKTSGEVYLEGKNLNIANYQDAIKKGLVYLTEDRKAEGLFLSMSIKHNVSAIALKRVANLILINRKKEKTQALDFVKSLNIRSSSIDQKVSDLSGGNQQKVLIAKLLTISPRVLFMDEPTRGIDVGAKVEIHNMLRQLTKQGIGIVIISSELPEIIGMCDRVIVMHEGRVTGVVTGEDINEEKIIHLAAGF
jgi:ribose transport system ATP-binding protein